MDYKIHVVEQHPIGLAVAFNVNGMKVQQSEALVDGIGDGLYLLRVGPIADDKVVGKGAGALL